MLSLLQTEAKQFNESTTGYARAKKQNAYGLTS